MILPKSKKSLTSENLILLVGILILAFFLVGRFLASMTSMFDPIEMAHLYRAYLISTGKVPYRDFGYNFTPLFASLFAPVFFFFKEQVAPVFLSRGLNVVIFLLNLIVIYLIGKISFNLRAGIAAGVLWSFSPFIFQYTIQIKPDNLAIFFWLLSFLSLALGEKGKLDSQKSLFLSGLSFGLSLEVCLKTVFGYPALILCLLLPRRDSFLKFFKAFLLFHFGFVIPWIIFGLLLWYWGTFNQAVYSVFTIQLEFNRAVAIQKQQAYHPFSIFYPSDARYGIGGQSLPWFLSNLTLLLGIGALIRIMIKVAADRDYQLIRVFLLSSFIVFAWGLLFVYNFTEGAYYIPLAPIISLVLADLFFSFEKSLLKKSRVALVVFWLWFFSIFSYGYKQMIQGFVTNPNLRNDWEINHIQDILAISKPKDRVYDMVGRYFFREPGNYYCCGDILDIYAHWFSRPGPEITSELKRTETKFVVSNWRWQYFNASTIAFLKENYFPSGVKDILVVGKRINLSGGKQAEFELIANASYRVSKESEGEVMIDGKPIFGDIIYLTKGRHLVQSRGVKELFLLYDFSDRD